MVRLPLRPPPQARAPSAVIDMVSPSEVLERTLADSALSVDCSAERRAASGLMSVTLLPTALSPLSEPQAASPVSAVTTATEIATRRTVLLFMSSHPYARVLCLHAGPGR